MPAVTEKWTATRPKEANVMKMKEGRERKGREWKYQPKQEKNILYEKKVLINP